MVVGIWSGASLMLNEQSSTIKKSYYTSIYFSEEMYSLITILNDVIIVSVVTNTVP